jgi:hypothetical protein
MAVVLVADGPVRVIDLRERSLAKARKFQMVASGAKIRDGITSRFTGLEYERVVPSAA